MFNAGARRQALPQLERQLCRLLPGDFGVDFRDVGVFVAQPHLRRIQSAANDPCFGSGGMTKLQRRPPWYPCLLAGPPDAAVQGGILVVIPGWPLSSPWKKSSGRFSTDENLRFSRTLRVRHVVPDVQQAVCPQPVRIGRAIPG